MEVQSCYILCSVQGWKEHRNIPHRYWQLYSIVFNVKQFKVVIRNVKLKFQIQYIVAYNYCYYSNFI